MTMRFLPLIVEKGKCRCLKACGKGESLERKMGERVGTPSWKANLEGIQVACYLFGEAYEKVKIEEKRREEKKSDRGRKLREMK